MTLEEFRTDVLTAMQNKPKEWRDGQFVFNYIDKHYGAARYVQLFEGVSPFYNDEKIETFITKCFETFCVRPYGLPEENYEDEWV